MKQVGPLPKSIELAKNIAQRVRQLRELRNMTVRDLAKYTKFGVKRIEDIETGLETWFSTADRQRLAKALSVEPALIEEVEDKYNHYYSAEHAYLDVPTAVKNDLMAAILKGERDLHCPACGSHLNCSVQHGFDMEGNAVQLAKAYCNKCPFLLR